MRNIPVFTTEFGVASLILKEIPYTQTAYIRIQSSLLPDALLEECVGFCRAAGAEYVYAAGDESLKKYPLHTKILLMEAPRSELPKTDAVARPVTTDQADRWRDCYNHAMANIANASFMSDLDLREMLKQGDGYFVYSGETPVGIGRASGDHIYVVASLVRGGGRDTTLALVPCTTAETVRLEVASTNNRAINLYQKLGFRQTAVISEWYKIIPGVT